MKPHVHRWAYFEIGEAEQMIEGGRWLAVCIEKSYPLCQEQKIDHVLPPGYRLLEEKVEYETRPSASSAYVFDEAELRRQLGAASEEEPPF